MQIVLGVISGRGVYSNAGIRRISEMHEIVYCLQCLSTGSLTHASFSFDSPLKSRPVNGISQTGRLSATRLANDKEQKIISPSVHQLIAFVPAPFVPASSDRTPLPCKAGRFSCTRSSVVFLRVSRAYTPGRHWRSGLVQNNGR